MNTALSVEAFLYSDKVPEATMRHSFRVARRDLGLSHSDVYIVALCHDLIEDGLATEADLYYLGVTAQQMAAIRLVTRDKEGQTYAEYIDKIVASKNHVAITVKILDIYDHLSPVRVQNLSKSRVSRYIKALSKLSLHLARDD